MKLTLVSLLKERLEHKNEEGFERGHVTLLTQTVFQWRSGRVSAKGAWQHTTAAKPATTSVLQRQILHKYPSLLHHLLHFKLFQCYVAGNFVLCSFSLSRRLLFSRKHFPLIRQTHHHKCHFSECVAAEPGN